MKWVIPLILAQRKAPEWGLRVHKPDSVPAPLPRDRDGHIPGTPVARRLVRLPQPRFFLTSGFPAGSAGAKKKAGLGTALHTGRNLAVSPLSSPIELAPERSGASSPLGSDVSARIPALARDGRYPLPGYGPKGRVCPDFPPSPGFATVLPTVSRGRAMAKPGLGGHLNSLIMSQKPP